MPFLTVCVVVIEEEKVLLTKRDDFHIWCLPSGGVEDGETVVEAAIRETKEETGIDVKITRMVGIYSRPANHTFDACSCIYRYSHRRCNLLSTR